MSYLNILISFLGLSFIVFFHELGHFLLFRYFGIYVEVFSIGFGGSIFEYKDSNETNWIFGPVLLGGYVQPLEYNNENKLGAEDAHPLKMVMIAFAGPLFNFILGFICIFVLSVSVGYPTMQYEVSHVVLGSVADRHGFRAGDKVIEVISKDGESITKGIVQTRVKNGSVIVIDRINENLNIKINIKDSEVFNGIGFKYSYVKLGFLKCLIASLGEVFGGIISAFLGIYLFLKSIFLTAIGFAGKDHAYRNLTGTIGIVKQMNYALMNGFADFLFILSRISISIGALNLLPIPICDGGVIMIKLTEWIIGQKLNEKFMNVLFIVSVAFMLGLFAFSTVLDVYKIFYSY